MSIGDMEKLEFIVAPSLWFSGNVDNSRASAELLLVHRQGHLSGGCP